MEKKINLQNFIKPDYKLYISIYNELQKLLKLNLLNERKNKYKTILSKYEEILNEEKLLKKMIKMIRKYKM